MLGRDSIVATLLRIAPKLRSLARARRLTWAASVLIVAASCDDDADTLHGVKGDAGNTHSTAGEESEAGATSAGGTRGGEAGAGDGSSVAGGGAGGRGASASGGQMTAGGAGAGAAGSPESGDGGEHASGATGGKAGSAGSGPCAFEIDASVSAAIATVGIVEWSLSKAPEQARIEFGLDTRYGLTAPVDDSGPNHRTLLLGMKPARDYHARIVAEGHGVECVSDDFVLTTGPRPNGLPTLTVSTPKPEARAGGYLITAFLQTGPSFILDADGEYVWWHGTGEFGRVEQSFDGKYMWDGDRDRAVRDGRIRRVSMDGLEEQSFPEFGHCHHDFTVLPDETVAFIERDPVDCDRIMERAPDGSVREVINVREVVGGTNTCHTNSLHFHAADDSYTFSDLHHDLYAKVTRDGHVVWVLGGSGSDFTGDGASWSNQHGHQLLEPNRLLFFNNGVPPASSLAIEVELDFESMTATRLWQYDAGIATPILGDVRRLDNGNTLIAYSLAGVIHEVDPNGELVESLSWSLGGGIAYVTKRASLYGPPPIQ